MIFKNEIFFAKSKHNYAFHANQKFLFYAKTGEHSLLMFLMLLENHTVDLISVLLNLYAKLQCSFIM